MPSFHVLRANNPSAFTLDGTRTFIVGHEAPVVIDPGPADPLHLEAIVRALNGRTPVAILITHHHEDHAAAAPLLQARVGGPILASSEPAREASAGSLLWAPLGHDLLIESDAGTIHAVETPGHTRDHFAFLLTEVEASRKRVLFAGDLFTGQGDTTLVAAPEGNVSAYLRSIERVGALAPDTIQPAHGREIDDVPRAVRRNREHRLMRLAQVQRALNRRPGAAPVDLVDLVYGPDLPAQLRAAAEASIRAMLVYLEGPIASEG